MKLASTTFLCDGADWDKHCSAKFTSHTDNNTEAYLELVDAGWRVIRHISKKWNHRCPNHREENGPEHRKENRL